MTERSAIHESHADLGARFVDFGGWEMPVQYSSVLDEHNAVRSSVGVFDVSHLGRFSWQGPDAVDALSQAFCNDIARLQPGRTQYTMALDQSGGILDDIILWRWSESLIWVLPNAANSDSITQICLDLAPGATAVDLRPMTTSLAIQGPEAPALLERLFGVAPKRGTIHHVDLDGAEVWVAGTGYTGERGGEVVVANESAALVFAAVVEAGAVPAGLGARDTLRLEAALPLWGQDLDASITPLEAGLDFAVSFDHEFTGKAALEAQVADGVAKHRVLFETEGRLIPRHGYRVRADVREGWVSSGNFSPTLGHGIGMAYIDGPPAGDL
ncbi:MAG: glycine cleavage system aminomethyltransferase GcvT, partial [Acidimicrobiia bacterium]|nr:glycine cleavage system aminomethyltransferase GcvT [Acidimicrobiia bacterium]